MTYDLKPCPFCGGEAEYHKRYIGVNAPNVVCPSCQCGTDTKDTEAKAITAWNTRTDNTNELEELRTLLAISRLNGSWDEHPDYDRVDVLLNTPSKENCND